MMLCLWLMWLLDWPFLHNEVDVPESHVLHLGLPREERDQRRGQLLQQRVVVVWVLGQEFKELHKHLNGREHHSRVGMGQPRGDALTDAKEEEQEAVKKSDTFTWVKPSTSQSSGMFSHLFITRPWFWNFCQIMVTNTKYMMKTQHSICGKLLHLLNYWDKSSLGLKWASYHYKHAKTWNPPL